MSRVKMMISGWNKKKLLCVAGIFVVVLVAVAGILLQKSVTNAKEPIANLEYFQKYDQSHKIGDYTIKLTHGIYSEKNRRGYCVFEVTKENGKMEKPEFFNGNTIKIFGEDRISICLNASGSITSRAKWEEEKLTIFTDFTARTVDDADEYNAGQIFLYYLGEEAACMNGAYGFQLQDNIEGKEYKINDETTVYLSYLGVLVESDKPLGELSVSVKTKKREEKVLLDLQRNSDIAGSLGEGYQEKDGEKIYAYTYSFDELYDLDEVKSVYINGNEVGE